MGMASMAICDYACSVTARRSAKSDKKVFLDSSFMKCKIKYCSLFKDLMVVDIQSIEKINFSIAANVSVGLVGLVIPGFLLFYIYDPALFERLDFVKLLVLSVAACLPTFLVPYGMSSLMHRTISQERPEVLDLWGTPIDWYVRHAFSNSLNMYTGILAVWLFDLGSVGIILSVISGVLFNALMECFHYWYFMKYPSSLYSIWLQPSTNSKSQIEQ